MTTGTIVWCIITVTLHTFGADTEQHDTAAKGRVTKVEKEYLQVDFSEYAKKQRYIGNYNSVRVKSYECTLD
jgi:hypothetical protein